MIATLAVMAAASRTGARGATFAERFIAFDPPERIGPMALVGRNGRAAILAPQAGRIGLIVLWATWCPPCRRDLPEIASAERRLVRMGFDVALVNVDAAPVASVRARSADIATGALPLFYDEDGDTLSTPLADGRRSPLQKFGMPIVFVVDRVGLVRGYVKGSVDWSNDAVLAFFRHVGDGASAPG